MVNIKLLSLTTISFLIFVACGSSSPSYSSYTPASRPSSPPRWAGIILTGENEQLLEGTSWIYNSSGAIFIHEFRANGKMVNRVTFENGTQGSSNYTWQREGNSVTIISNDGNSLYEGKYYPETKKLMLDYELSSGHTGHLTWDLYQGTSIVSSPATPAPTTVIIQPSSPAQTSVTPSAPNAPSLRGGTYGLSGTKATISIASVGKAGVINYVTTDGRRGIGSYGIEGNRMTISMEGYTFVYTITSETSFSGNGETWVRTGY